MEQASTNNDITGTIQMAMFDPWTNSVPPLEDMVSLVMKPNSKMTLKMHNSKVMQQYSGMGKQFLTQYAAMVANKVFGQTLGLDNEMVQKVGRFMQTAIISYFSTTDCNGKEVYDRFIKNDFQKDDVVEVLLKLMRFPTSKAFKKILTDNKIQINEQVLKNLESHQKKNVLDIVGGVIEDISKAPKKDMKNLKDIAKVIGRDTSFDVFEKEFFALVQKLFEQLRKVVKDKNTDFNKLDFNFLGQYLSAPVKTKVVSTLKNVIEVLKKWDYDSSKPPHTNILVLVEKLDDIKAFDHLLNLDYVKILAQNIIRKSKFPDAIETALTNYLRTLDHIGLIQKISKFALQSFGVPAPHKSYVDKLLSSKNIDEYFLTMAKSINQDGKLTVQQQQMVTQYLETRKHQIIYDGIKTTLETKYKVSKTGIDLMDTLLVNGGDLKSFKSLPTMYSVNFFPKVAMKVLTNMKNLDLPAVLQQLNSLIKDQGIRDALQGILESKQNLDEVPTILLKLAMKKIDDEVGEAMTEEDKTVLKEVNNLSLKFLSVALGKEKSAGRLIKKLVIQYQAKTYSALEEILPGTLKPILGKLYTEILNVVQKINTDEFDKDATTVLMKTVDEISSTTSKFIGANFERFMKEDFAKTLQEALQKLPVDEKTSMWDLIDM